MSEAAVRRRAYICLAIAVTLMLGVLVVALAHRAPRRSGSNGVDASKEIGVAEAGDRFCQPHELIPADTAALKVSLIGEAPLLVTLTRRGRLLERVRVPFGWTAGGFVVPIHRTTHDVADVAVCFTVKGHGPVTLLGSHAPATIGQATIDGRGTERSIRIDDLRPGRESWLAFLPTIVQRIGRDRGSWGGPWVVGLILALALAAWGLAGRVVRRAVLGNGAPLRTTARAIALVAVLNAAAWSFITPAFEAPDEQVHVAYAQEVGEAGRPPVRKGPQAFALSPELRAALVATRSEIGALDNVSAGVWTPTEEQQLERMVSRRLPRRGNGDAGASDAEPPLYYALAAVPYRVFRGGTLLTRLAAMRLLSALLAGVTAASAFLFVRECLPRRPWAWSVGGLVAAFAPMFGFLSGSVNPDALMIPVTSVLLYCLARAFRRGMTRRNALWIGAAIGAGMLTKINFDVLVPGALLATALAARRSERRWSRRVVGYTGAAAALGLAPYLVLKGLDAAVWGRPFTPSHDAYIPPFHGSLLDKLSYAWQVYLPRLPGMRPAFPSYVGYEMWFKSFVGKFGAVTIPLPEWAYQLALGCFALLAALAARALVVGRAIVRQRWSEALSYLLMVGGLLALIAYVLMRGWVPGVFSIMQGRYLLPFLPLFAAFVALAARGAGERWGRTVGATMVVVAIGWSVLGQLVAISGYYA